MAWFGPKLEPGERVVLRWPPAPMEVGEEHLHAMFEGALSYW